MSFWLESSIGPELPYQLLCSNMASSPHSHFAFFRSFCLVLLFSFFFCYLYLLFFFSSSPFLSHTEHAGFFFCFKYNISTLQQKKRDDLFDIQTDIHFDYYYSCMLSFFLRQLHDVLCFLFLFYSLTFHRSFVHFLLKAKKIFGNKRSTFSKVDAHRKRERDRKKLPFGNVTDFL